MRRAPRTKAKTLPASSACSIAFAPISQNSSSVVRSVILQQNQGARQLADAERCARQSSICLNAMRSSDTSVMCRVHRRWFDGQHMNRSWTSTKCSQPTLRLASATASPTRRDFLRLGVCSQSLMRQNEIRHLACTPPHVETLQKATVAGFMSLGKQRLLRARTLLADVLRHSS